ncbi:hypothetical protein BLA24_11590 [Streptomyces cinnamoneus]|uniref:MmpS family membrane protein n=1 Tax=Streptomyces cinnamoneus TaxID=53446 RepID=A0A2G1XKG0_STRCJ|nr:hypothetical protein [Streptomyces cinnamoneus]PHQ51725.1 hypothetical protein BLA24_11590 [Streptomyces cinnamoneus]PPT11973.1 hypothetical protein CYQ11_02825 [Streptomyces cinnamoneus]
MSHPMPPHASKRRKWPWVLLVLALLIVGGCAALFLIVSKEYDKTVTVRYEVTGDAKDASVSYSTWDNGAIKATKAGPLPSLPWRKVITTKGFAKGGVLAASTGAGGGTVTCKVTVDDGKPVVDSARGAYATATCQGF